MCKTIFTFLFFCLCFSLQAQLPVHFMNPSFEGIPGPSKLFIKAWADCGSREFELESPFDLQPGSFEVDLEPFHGRSFLGMVTRANGSHESVCQGLDSPLLKDSLYQFSIFLAKSNKYISPVLVKNPVTGEVFSKNSKNLPHAPYIHSTILRVWGGRYKCSKEELLYQTYEIDHEDWKEYVIEFVPTSSKIQFISLETYYPDDFNFTRGNLMLDNITTIKSPE